MILSFCPIRHRLTIKQCVKRMKMKNIILISGVVAGVMLLSSAASAACYCACINNKKTKVCENSWDANYVYCGGTYCSSDLDLPKESPFEDNEAKPLLALFSNKSPMLMSVAITN